MADISKRVPTCDDDKRGKRGRRGPRGRDASESCGDLCDKTKNPLGWNRIHLTIAPFTTLLIDTGIGRSDNDCSDPILAVIPENVTDIPPFTDNTGVVEITTLIPIPGTLPPSRIMVIPLSPINQWLTVTQPTEPFFNPATNTVNITLANGGLLPVEINLLVWNPSCFSGPGEADVYANRPDILDPINHPTP